MALPGDVIENPVTGERFTFLRTAAETGGELLQVELTVKPGGFLPLAHTHPFQEERFAIRSGTMVITVDGVERVLEPGDSVAVPAGAPHEWHNGGEGDLVAIVEFRPALNAEACFESSFGLAQDGLVDPASGIPLQPWLALIFDAYQDFVHPIDPPIDLLLEQFRPIVVAARQQGLRMPYPYPYDRLAGTDRATA
jgi:mannose-6-phosphate isomerase-like protein (cupin superfamily)